MKDHSEIEEKNESLDDLRKEETMEWYYRPWMIVLAILFFGPLGLVPLWFRPKTKIYVKVLISVVVIALTFWMVRETFIVYDKMVNYYKELSDLM
jgi:hypothetical protein